MQTRTTEKLDNDGNPIPPDIMPDVDDDVEPRPSEARQTDDGSDAQPRQEKPQAQLADDPRTDIAKMYREMRDAERAKAADEDEDGDGEGDGDDESVRTQITDPKDDQGQVSGDGEPKPDENDPLTTLKVDGIELRLPLSQVKALAQRNIAGENRLNEAKHILDDVKALRGQASPTHQRDEPDKGHEPSQAPSHTDPASSQAATHQSDDLGIDRAKLEEVVERIQVGDKEDGVQAVMELVKLIGDSKPALDEQTVFQLARQAVVQSQTDTEIKAAVDGFGQRYQPLVSDPYLKMATITRLTDEMAHDLRQAGIRDEDIAQVRGDLRTMGHWINTLRAQGRQVRTYDKILNDVGEFVVQKFKVELEPTTQPGSRNQQQQDASQASRQRLERKRSLPSQPRSASVRVQVPQPQKPRTYSDVVMEMRRVRGFA